MHYEAFSVYLGADNALAIRLIIRPEQIYRHSDIRKRVEEGISFPGGHGHYPLHNGKAGEPGERLPVYSEGLKNGQGNRYPHIGRTVAELNGNLYATPGSVKLCQVFIQAVIRHEGRYFLYTYDNPAGPFFGVSQHVHGCPCVFPP